MRFIFAILIFLMASGAAAAKELVIGLIPEQNIFKQQAQYAPLGKYIEKKTGIKIKFTIMSRYGDIIERFSADKMDGAFFGSYTGALAIRKLEVEPIVRPVGLDGTSTYHGYVFVRKDSGINSVSDMKGKRVVFVEKATTAGYVYPMAYFKEHGIANIVSFFKEHYFAGSHDAAIFAVLEKKADIGCAKSTIFESLARTDPRISNELAILAKSPDVPSNGLCVSKNIDSSIIKQLKDVLVNMDKDPEGREVLKKLEVLRFVQTSKEDFKPVFRYLPEGQRSGAGIDAPPVFVTPARLQQTTFAVFTSFKRPKVFTDTLPPVD